MPRLKEQDADMALKTQRELDGRRAAPLGAFC
jgi:hypothetical protein